MSNLDQTPFEEPHAAFRNDAPSASTGDGSGGVSPTASEPALGDPPRHRRHGTRWRTVVGVSLVAAVIGAGTATGIEMAFGPRSSPPAVTGSPVATIERPGEIQAMLAKVLPAIVSIQTTTAHGRGAGTGVILSPDGEVLTNHHVIQGASVLTVTRYGTTLALPATVVGSSSADDLALVRVEGARDLPTVTLGWSGAVKVGDTVFAIGNALGLSDGSPSVTQGIISATGRSLDTGPARGAPTPSGLLQTDAAISPGNSGGPLVNSSGEVIGLNTAVAVGSSQAPAQNIGFAIPSDHVRDLLPQLRSATVTQPTAGWLGVPAVTVTEALRQANRLAPETGALITEVASGSPAADVGLAPSDVVAQAGGPPVDSGESLAQAMADHRPDDGVQLDPVRGSNQLSLIAVVSEHDAS